MRRERFERKENRVTIDLYAIRSILFLPASNPRAIARARGSAADLVVLDLEDSVPDEDKDTARQAALEAVAEGFPMPVAIRVNVIGSRWHSPDVAAVAGSKADFAVLPRTMSAHLTASVREAVSKPLLAMIETAAGVLSAPAIAHEVAALIAGTNDLAADLQLPPGAGRESMAMALQSTILAARAAKIAAFDGVHNRLEDDDGLAAACAHGRALGFDGKSLIHPAQIAICNRLFAPSDDEIASARRLLDAFGGGAQRFEGRMIERMHVDTARRLLARSDRKPAG